MRNRAWQVVRFLLVTIAGLVALTSVGSRAAEAPDAPYGETVDLSISKTDSPIPVTAGNNLTYTITVTNLNGTTAAAGGQMDDTLPAGTTFVSMSGPVGWTLTTPAVGSGGSVQATNPTVAAGSVSVFTLVVKVLASTPQGTLIANTATITAQTPDPFLGNNTSGVESGVTTSADLSITKTGATSVTAGSNLVYTVTVTNAGPSDATFVGVTDTLPGNTTFVSAVAPVGWQGLMPSVGAFGGTVTLSKPAVAAGVAPQVFTITVNVPGGTIPGTPIVNQASVLSSVPDNAPSAVAGRNTPDPTPANNASTLTTTVVAPVPTVTTWMLLALGLGVLGLGALALRRRRTAVA